MRISIILGTRPEIIKLSPVIKEIGKREIDYFVLHTGQHYSYDMDKIFFDALELNYPKYNLNIGSGTHAEETGKMIMGIEKILQKEKPDVVLIAGDTNTVLSGALTAVKMHIKVGHIEAGARSYFKGMPEEINRIITDHISDYLFVSVRREEDILIGEGIERERIFLTGNTIVDSVYQNLKIAEDNNLDILDKLGLIKGRYALATAHRQAKCR